MNSRGSVRVFFGLFPKEAGHAFVFIDESLVSVHGAYPAALSRLRAPNGTPRPDAE